jgi:hypothetical protein
MLRDCQSRLPAVPDGQNEHDVLLGGEFLRCISSSAGRTPCTGSVKLVARLRTSSQCWDGGPVTFRYDYRLGARREALIIGLHPPGYFTGMVHEDLSHANQFCLFETLLSAAV